MVSSISSGEGSVEKLYSEIRPGSIWFFSNGFRSRREAAALAYGGHCTSRPATDQIDERLIPNPKRRLESERMAVDVQGSIADLVRDDMVRRRIFTDPAIFDLELERIFNRSWIC